MFSILLIVVETRPKGLNTLGPVKGDHTNSGSTDVGETDQRCPSVCGIIKNVLSNKLQALVSGAADNWIGSRRQGHFV